MAQALIVMYQEAKSGWIVFKKSNEDLLYQKLLAWNFTKLPCWGLIESQKIEGQGARRRWRLTRAGLDFVRGKSPIHCYVRIPTGTGNTAFGPPFGDLIFMKDVKPVDRNEILREST